MPKGQGYKKKMDKERRFKQNTMPEPVIKINKKNPNTKGIKIQTKRKIK
jgi:hypothetical protein